MKGGRLRGGRQVRQRGISGRLRCRHAGQVRDGAAAGRGMMRVSSRKKEKGNREREMKKYVRYWLMVMLPTTQRLAVSVMLLLLLMLVLFYVPRECLTRTA